MVQTAQIIIVDMPYVLNGGDYSVILLSIIVFIVFITLLAVDVPLSHQLRAKHVYKGDFKTKADSVRIVDIRGIKVNRTDHPHLNWHLSTGNRGFVYDNEDSSFNNVALLGLRCARDPAKFCVLREFTGVRATSRMSTVELSFISANVVAFGIDKILVDGQRPDWEFTSTTCKVYLPLNDDN
jgi:hypothetical protein